MREFPKLIQSTQLYIQSSVLLFRIASLQRRIRKCNQQLRTKPLDNNTIRDLEDELFGCRIEAQSLMVHINRLIAEARSPSLAVYKE